jgi:hypothetical protein
MGRAWTAVGQARGPLLSHRQKLLLMFECRRAAPAEPQRRAVTGGAAALLVSGRGRGSALADPAAVALDLPRSAHRLNGRAWHLTRPAGFLKKPTRKLISPNASRV